MGLPWTPQGSHTPCTGSGAEYRGLPPLRLRLGLPPDEHGPQDRLGPPQMSLHAMVQLPAAACLHCSPDVPALGNKVCQASRVSLAVIHQCHPNQPSPLSRALGRGLVQFCPALKHQTRAVVTGQCAVVSSVPHSHVLIQRRSITSNTLSQAMGDQLGSPHWWLLEGQWHRGMLQASAWGRKAIAQCEGMLGLPKVCQYLYWAAYQHTSGLGSREQQQPPAMGNPSNTLGISRRSPGALHSTWQPPSRALKPPLAHIHDLSPLQKALKPPQDHGSAGASRCWAVTRQHRGMLPWLGAAHGCPWPGRSHSLPGCRCPSRRCRRWRCLRLLCDTRAGELPRLTYTLFILTLIS